LCFGLADWLLILVHFIKYMRHGQDVSNQTETLESVATDDFGGFALKDYYLEGLPYFLVPATAVSYIMYLGIGGFLHWYYYVRQRENAHEWKTQPTKWLSPQLERHEILLGASSLLIGSILSGIMSCYIMNGGPHIHVYYDFLQHGWLWAIAQWPAIFIWQVNLNVKRPIVVGLNFIVSCYCTLVALGLLNVLASQDVSHSMVV